MAETMEDLEPLVTRCPECGTRFRVSEAQLQMAGGRVRCGSCLTVFFGTDHLQWDLEQAATTADPGETLDELLKEIDVFEAADGVQADEALVPPEPVADWDELPERGGEDPAGQEPAGQEPAGEEPAEEEASREANTAASVEPLDDPVTGVEPAAAFPAVADTQLTDHGAPATDRFVSLFDDPPEAPKVLGAPPEPDAVPDDTAIARVSPVEAAIAEAAIAEAASPEVASPEAASPVEAVPPVSISRRSRRNRAARRPAPAPKAEATQATATIPAPSVELPEPEVPGLEAQPRRRGVRWMLLLPVGVILIAAQVMIYFFPAWSADPKMRWVPEQVCAIGGCELEPLKALDQLLITDVVIRAHPEDPDLRLVNVLLVNTASFEQAFPDVEIAFRAPTNDLVAWKRVPASEYLSASLQGRQVIPEKTPVRIEFTIEDPGTQSYGYEISLK